VHQDQKIGLSLAVLLIGFAGAFCFRHEPLPVRQSLALDRADELDERIEHLPLRAYTEREGVSLPGGRGNGKRPVAVDGPLSDVLEIGRTPRAAAVSADTDRGDLIPLFAGPPEPLRIAQSRAANGPARFRTAAAPSTPSRRTPGVEQAHSGPRPATSAVREQRGEPLPPHPVLAMGDASSPRPSPPAKTYKVRPGDTLSELAQQFLGSSRRYHELYEANRDVLSSPHALRAGMVLRIPTER